MPRWKPTDKEPLHFEQARWAAGDTYVAGVDEVGRGCLAGPVVAAAVIFPPEFLIPGVDDSKRLSPAARERLHPVIVDGAVAVGIGWVDAAEIDIINILQATRRAMRMAVQQLAVSPDHLLIDGRECVALDIPQTAIIGGDRRSHAIAAASIVAKVTRDRMMVAFERDYPGFRFSRHKGYGTAQHLAELLAHGVTPLHRCSFNPCRNAAVRGAGG